MGINLGSTDAWAPPSDQLVAGNYLMKPCDIERTTSSKGNPQVQIDWTVVAGQYQGAERRDWVTVTENAMGRVKQLVVAADLDVPEEDFPNLEAVADWLAGALQKALPVVEVVVRMKEDRKGTIDERTGHVKVWPEVEGYMKPNPSEVPNDTTGFRSGPKVDDGAQKKAPF